jgi:hypothetical protein
MLLLIVAKEYNSVLQTFRRQINMKYTTSNYLFFLNEKKKALKKERDTRVSPKNPQPF